ncbi:MAG TPA: hypothetical protein VK760_06600 [Candidatus Acidoferrales bacterium]|jgi:hypothetical protein|nr:hypothetical protein [Candidatus Acidoferrales bacterium]
MIDFSSGRDLARKMLDLSLPDAEFRHRQHLELAYYYLVRHDCDVATRLVAISVRDFAASKGKTNKFHLTLTGCWTRLVAAAVHAHTPIPSFEQVLALHPDLLDKDLPAAYYSKSLLSSQVARDSFIDSDIHPLPEIRGTQVS